MGTFRKQPVVIEAVQWSGSNWHEILAFAGNANVYVIGNNLFVRTTEGELRAKATDWIIRGVMGEFYPCDATIFDMTYEEVPPPEGEAA